MAETLTPRWIGAGLQDGKTPLHAASKAAHKEMARILIAAKASVNIGDQARVLPPRPCLPPPGLANLPTPRLLA